MKFDLAAFKNLKSLQIDGISVNNITHMGPIRQTLNQLAWYNTECKQINEFLLCDCIHKTDTRLDQVWSELETINLSSNKLTDIDSSIKLAPKLKSLMLDNNHITAIRNLSTMTFLQSLSLCENFISECPDCHLELGGNLVQLNLSQNQIRSLKGFRKMYSLVKLDLSCNAVDSIDEVDWVAELPSLEEIVLTGNPIAGTVDYRSRVLARFGSERCHDIYLDNEKANAQEIDTALVLAAFKQSQTFSTELLQQSLTSISSGSCNSTGHKRNNIANGEVDHSADGDCSVEEAVDSSGLIPKDNIPS